MPPKVSKKILDKFADDGWKPLLVAVDALNEQGILAEQIISSKLISSRQKFGAISRTELLQWIRDNKGVDQVKEVLGSQTPTQLSDIDLAKMLKTRLLYLKQEKIDEKSNASEGTDKKGTKEKESIIISKKKLEDGNETNEDGSKSTSRREKLRDRPPVTDYDLPLLPLMDEPPNLGIDFYCLLLDFNSKELIEELSKSDIHVSVVIHLRSDAKLEPKNADLQWLCVKNLDTPLNMSSSILLSIITTACFDAVTIQKEFKEYSEKVKIVKINTQETWDGLTYNQTIEKFPCNNHVDAVVLSMMADACNETPDQKDLISASIASYYDKKIQKVKVKQKKDQKSTPIIERGDLITEFAALNGQFIDECFQSSLKYIDDGSSAFQQLLKRRLLQETQKLGQAGTLRNFETKMKFSGNLLSMEPHIVLYFCEHNLEYSLKRYLWKKDYSQSLLRNRLEKFLQTFPTYETFYCDYLNALILFGDKKHPQNDKTPIDFPVKHSLYTFSRLKEDGSKEFKSYAYDSNIGCIEKNKQVFYLSDGSTLVFDGKYVKVSNLVYSSVIKNNSFNLSVFQGQVSVTVASSKLYNICMSLNQRMSILNKDKLTLYGQNLKKSLIIDYEGRIYSQHGVLLFQPSDLNLRPGDDSKNITWSKYLSDSRMLGTKLDGVEIILEKSKNTITLYHPSKFSVTSSLSLPQDFLRFQSEDFPSFTLRDKLFIVHIDDLFLNQSSDLSFDVMYGKTKWVAICGDRVSLKSPILNSADYEILLNKTFSIKKGSEIEIADLKSQYIPFDEITEYECKRLNSLNDLVRKNLPENFKSPGEILILNEDFSGYELIDELVFLPFIDHVQNSGSKVLETVTDGNLSISISFVKSDLRNDIIEYDKYTRLFPLSDGERGSVEAILAAIDQKLPPVRDSLLKETGINLEKLQSEKTNETLRKLMDSEKNNAQLLLKNGEIPPYFESEEGQKFLLHGDNVPRMSQTMQEQSVEKSNDKTLKTDEEVVSIKEDINGETAVDLTLQVKELRPMLAYDYLGNPRKSKPEIPIQVRNDTFAESQANEEYEKSSGALRRKLKTASFSQGHNKISSLAVYPPELALLSNEDGEVLMTNHGVEPIRCRILIPDWLEVKYKVGPIAPGMTTKMSVQAKKSGLTGILKIITEWEIINVTIKS